MTTIPHERTRRRTWLVRSGGQHLTPTALTLAAYYADRAVPHTGGMDACLLTHRQVRCTGLAGDRVHRLDSARASRFYTTACGLRVAKIAATLTAADITCQHHGCRRREDVS